MVAVLVLSIGVVLAAAVSPESITLATDGMPLERLKQANQRPPAILFPADNSHTRERETLGKMLFFDWEDGRPVAMGFAAKLLARRTPTILNLAWTELLLWDGRADGLGREGRLDGAAALLARLEPELDRVRGAATEAIAAGMPAWARAPVSRPSLSRRAAAHN